MDAWNHNDFISKNYILNGLYNTLYDVHSSIKKAKSLWEALDKKLKVEDVNIKKFIIGKFLDFKMVDLRTGMSQVQEFQLILHDIHVESMSLSAYSQMVATIKKLSPSRKDFKKYFKHKQKEMRVKNLILKLRIKKDIH